MTATVLRTAAEAIIFGRVSLEYLPVGIGEGAG